MIAQAARDQDAGAVGPAVGASRVYPPPGREQKAVEGPRVVGVLSRQELSRDLHLVIVAPDEEVGTEVEVMRATKTGKRLRLSRRRPDSSAWTGTGGDSREAGRHRRAGGDASGGDLAARLAWDWRLSASPYRRDGTGHEGRGATRWLNSRGCTAAAWSVPAGGT